MGCREDKIVGTFKKKNISSFFFLHSLLLPQGEIETVASKKRERERQI